MSELRAESQRIIWTFDRQTLVIEPWGAHSLRVRATCQPELIDYDLALLSPAACEVEIQREHESLSLRNGNITATLNIRGQLAFYNQH